VLLVNEAAVSNDGRFVFLWPRMVGMPEMQEHSSSDVQ